MINTSENSVPSKVSLFYKNLYNLFMQSCIIFIQDNVYNEIINVLEIT